ncbi:Cyclin-P3-1 protein [Pelomyxa schiedti]|nr:Cyclin-P3-1 protein [Pelomyxa schiedti]
MSAIVSRHKTHKSGSVAPAVSLLLKSLINWQAKLSTTTKEDEQARLANTYFQGASGKAPAISLQAYVERIEEHSGCSRANIISALVYIDRLLISRAVTLTETNVHRVLWSCLVVAHKFFEDQYFTNSFYSKVGGVPLAEMNAMEVRVLQLLDYGLFITPEKYAQYESVLQTSITYCEEVAQREVENSDSSMHVQSSASLPPAPKACTSDTTLPESHLITATVE